MNTLSESDGDPLTFGEVLRSYRRDADLTQKALAARAGYSPSYLNMLERGGRLPGADTARTLAEALKLPAQQRAELAEAARRQRRTAPRDGARAVRRELGEIPDTPAFHGRQEELHQLTHWIAEEGCRVAGVLGIGGVGKTALMARAAQALRGSFEYLYWCPLYNAPPLADVLRECIPFLSGQELIELPGDLAGQIALLVRVLRDHRCLLVFDNMESVLCDGQHTGHYRAGYEGYGLLLRRVSETRHQSCLALTSRERLDELLSLGGAPVRTLELRGLAPGESQALLVDAGLSGSEEAWAELVARYAGNPLALKLIAEPVRTLFGGDIAAFLREGVVTFGGVHDLCARQVARLSPLEQEVLRWLAIEREPVALETLRADLVPSPSTRALLETLDSLRRRFLIEARGGAHYALQPVILEYLTDQVLTEAGKELAAGELRLLAHHALIKADAREYVRASQERVILRPIAAGLGAHLRERGARDWLAGLLAALHQGARHAPGYAAGNLLNLLAALGHDLSGLDCSGLVIWQAHLRDVPLRDVSFRRADLSGCVFAEEFGGVLCVAYSPDARMLAAGTVNAEIRLWHAATGTPVRTIPAHQDWIGSVAFSPDGRLLASGSDDQTVRLWHVADGTCQATLRGHGGRVRVVTFSPDGRQLASCSDDQTVRLWDVADGRCLTTLRGHTLRIWSVAFSPDGRLIASGSGDRTIRLWEAATGRCRRVLRGQAGRVWSVAFSPDGMLLASGSEDRRAWLWDVARGAPLRSLAGHGDWVKSVTFSPDGRVLATGSDDQTVRLWDAASGRCRAVLRGHTNRVWAVAFSPDGQTLASGGCDQVIQVWDAATGQCLKTLRGHANQVWAVAFSPDGATLASGSDDHLVRLWDVASRSCRGILAGHTNRVTTLAFRPGCSGHGELASASDDATIRLWETASGHCRAVLRGHTNWVLAVAFRPDGQMLASGSEDRTVRLWDAASGHAMRVLTGHAQRVRSVAFHRDGVLVASGSEDRTVRLWDAASGRCRAVLRGHTSEVWSVAFSPDGLLLASGSEDHSVRVWEVAGGRCLKLLRGPGNQYWSVAFSAEGQVLAAGGDQAIDVWDMASGDLLGTLRGHVNQVWSVALSADGRLAASGGEDGAIKLWARGDGACLATLVGERPYERMDITGATGLSEAQRIALRALGAVERG